MKLRDLQRELAIIEEVESPWRRLALLQEHEERSRAFWKRQDRRFLIVLLLWNLLWVGLSVVLIAA